VGLGKKKKISEGFVGIGETEPVQGFTKQFFETAFDKINDSFEKPFFKILMLHQTCLVRSHHN